MSRKISNILVICAMVVVFPLLIIGSAFAAYYSINATVNVGIYAGEEVSQSASASVVYNSKANTETFEISGSHAKVITLKANATGYEFKGWFNGTKETYLEAELADDVKYFNTEKELTVKISEHENILAVYEIIPFTITYNVNGTTTSQTTKGTTTLKDASQAAQDAGLGAAATGKKWAWVDEDGNVITTAEADITVTLSQVAVEYTITVAGGEGISYTGSAVKANYDSNATTLDTIFDEENYTTTLAFKSFDSVTYAGNAYTDPAALLAAIKADHANADATIELTPVVDDTFNNIKITTLKYRAGRLLPSGICLYDQKVYVSGLEYGDQTNYEEVSTSSLEEALSLGAEVEYTDVDDSDLTYVSITLVINGNTFDYNGGKDTTINDMLTEAYKEHASEMGSGETLIVEEAIVKFI